MRIYTASEHAVMKSQLELSSMETFAAPCLNSQCADKVCFRCGRANGRFKKDFLLLNLNADRFIIGCVG
jgi:hypothetical protein